MLVSSDCVLQSSGEPNERKNLIRSTIPLTSGTGITVDVLLSFNST
jgi:hypothetical protein